MADHVSDFPSQKDLSDFLRSLSDKPEGLVQAGVGVPFHTMEKWYRDKPPAMSAVSLLRVLIAMNGEKQFAEWLRQWRRTERPRAIFAGAGASPPPTSTKGRAGTG